MIKVAVQYYLKKHLFLLVAIVFFAVYYSTIIKIPERATVFPRLLVYLIIPITVWNLFTSIREVVKEVSVLAKNNSTMTSVEHDRFLPRKITVVCLTLIYILLIPVIGFYIMTTIYLGVVLFIFGITKPLSIFLYVAGVDIFLFLVFTQWVGLPFPKGILI